MFGLDHAGKTHMLYNYLVGEGGMHTIKKLKETLGMNYEHIVESQADFNIWDISGAPLLRKNWKLYLKNVPVAGIIYVVNISEDIERLRESKKQFHKIINESALQDCIAAIVYNIKPNLQILNPNAGQATASKDVKGGKGATAHTEIDEFKEIKPTIKKKDEWVESPFN